MEPYTFTDTLGATVTLYEGPSGGLRVRCDETGYDRGPAEYQTLGRELLRVVAERDRLAAWKREAEVHIAADGARIRELEAEAERLEVLDRDRIAALEEENARLRASLSRCDWEETFAERQAVVAALERIRSSGAAAAIANGFRGHSTDRREHVKVYQALADYFRTGRHRETTGAPVPPQQGSPAAGDEGAAGEGEQEPSKGE